MSTLTQNRIRIITGSVITLGLIGVSAVAIQSAQTGAEELPPLVQQVNDHEGRIDSLETKQTDTEAKVEQTQSDVTALQQVTGSAPTQTSTGRPATTVPSTTQTTATSTTDVPSEPAPAPAPVINPRTITAVSESLEGGMRACDYTLYGSIENGLQGIVLISADSACERVGEILPVQ